MINLRGTTDIRVGPVGRVASGHVLDCNKRGFDQALRAYDPMLYTVWNPKKCKGHGCWEIRRRPEFNSAVDVVEYEGAIIIKVGPHEVDLVHQVLDCGFLNYDALRKLKEMDAWQYGTTSQYLDLMDRKTQDKKEQELSDQVAYRRDAARYFKKQIRALKQFVLDGGNPHEIADFWNKVSALE